MDVERLLRDKGNAAAETLVGKVLTARFLYVAEIRDGSIQAAIAEYAVRHRRSNRPATGKKAEKLLARLDVASAG